jgi:hypothetical protein
MDWGSQILWVANSDPTSAGMVFLENTVSIKTKEWIQSGSLVILRSIRGRVRFVRKSTDKTLVFEPVRHAAHFLS